VTGSPFLPYALSDPLREALWSSRTSGSRMEVDAACGWWSNSRLSLAPAGKSMQREDVQTPYSALRSQAMQFRARSIASQRQTSTDARRRQDERSDRLAPRRELSARETRALGYKASWKPSLLNYASPADEMRLPEGRKPASRRPEGDIDWTHLTGASHPTTSAHAATPLGGTGRAIAHSGSVPSLLGGGASVLVPAGLRSEPDLPHKQDPGAAGWNPPRPQQTSLPFLARTAPMVVRMPPLVGPSTDEAAAATPSVEQVASKHVGLWSDRESQSSTDRSSKGGLSSLAFSARSQPAGRAKTAAIPSSSASWAHEGEFHKDSNIQTHPSLSGRVGPRVSFSDDKPRGVSTPVMRGIMMQQQQQPPPLGSAARGGSAAPLNRGQGKMREMLPQLAEGSSDMVDNMSVASSPHATSPSHKIDGDGGVFSFGGSRRASLDAKVLGDADRRRRRDEEEKEAQTEAFFSGSQDLFRTRPTASRQSLVDSAAEGSRIRREAARQAAELSKAKYDLESLRKELEVQREAAAEAAREAEQLRLAAERLPTGQDHSRWQARRHLPPPRADRVDGGDSLRTVSTTMNEDFPSVVTMELYEEARKAAEESPHMRGGGGNLRGWGGSRVSQNTGGSTSPPGSPFKVGASSLSSQRSLSELKGVPSPVGHPTDFVATKETETQLRDAVVRMRRDMRGRVRERAEMKAALKRAQDLEHMAKSQLTHQKQLADALAVEAKELRTQMEHMRGEADSLLQHRSKLVRALRVMARQFRAADLIRPQALAVARMHTSAPPSGVDHHEALMVAVAAARRDGLLPLEQLQELESSVGPEMSEEAALTVSKALEAVGVAPSKSIMEVSRLQADGSLALVPTRGGSSPSRVSRELWTAEMADADATAFEEEEKTVGRRHERYVDNAAFRDALLVVSIENGVWRSEADRSQNELKQLRREHETLKRSESDLRAEVETLRSRLERSDHQQSAITEQRRELLRGLAELPRGRTMIQHILEELEISISESLTTLLIEANDDDDEEDRTDFPGRSAVPRGGFSASDVAAAVERIMDRRVAGLFDAANRPAGDTPPSAAVGGDEGLSSEAEAWSAVARLVVEEQRGTDVAVPVRRSSSAIEPVRRPSMSTSPTASETPSVVGKRSRRNSALAMLLNVPVVATPVAYASEASATSPAFSSNQDGTETPPVAPLPPSVTSKRPPSPHAPVWFQSPPGSDSKARQVAHALAKPPKHHGVKSPTHRASVGVFPAMKTAQVTIDEQDISIAAGVLSTEMLQHVQSRWAVERTKSRELAAASGRGRPGIENLTEWIQTESVSGGSHPDLPDSPTDGPGMFPADTKRKKDLSVPTAVLSAAQMQAFERVIRGLGPMDVWMLALRMRRVLSLFPLVDRTSNIAGAMSVLSTEAGIVTDAERAVLFLYEAHEDSLWTRRPLPSTRTNSAARPRRDSNPVDFEEIRIPAVRTVAGWVARHACPLVIHDAYSDTRFDPESDARLGLRTKNILTVPVLDLSGPAIASGDEPTSRVIGVLQVVNKKGGAPFTNLDIVLLGLVALPCCVALRRGLAEIEQSAQGLAPTPLLLQTALPSVLPLALHLRVPHFPDRFTSRLPVPPLWRTPEHSFVQTVDIALAWVERVEQLVAHTLRAPGCRLFVVDLSTGYHDGGFDQSIHDQTGEAQTPRSPSTSEACGKLWWSSRDLVGRALGRRSLQSLEDRQREESERLHSASVLAAAVASSSSPSVEVAALLGGAVDAAEAEALSGRWSQSVPDGRRQWCDNHSAKSLAGRSAGRSRGGAEVLEIGQAEASPWMNAKVDVDPGSTALAIVPCTISVGDPSKWTPGGVGGVSTSLLRSVFKQDLASVGSHLLVTGVLEVPLLAPSAEVLVVLEELAAQVGGALVHLQAIDLQWRRN
jgi:predicted nuclease with TOPRIM domain